MDADWRFWKQLRTKKPTQCCTQPHSQQRVSRTWMMTIRELYSVSKSISQAYLDPTADIIPDIDQFRRV